MNLINQSRRWIASLLVMLTLLCGVAVAAPAASADTYYNGSTAIAWDQRNSAWAWYYYGGGSIYDTACGVLSSCNAINYLTGAFNTTDKAKTFILDWANYAYNLGAFNPNADGMYRYMTFGTDVSNPPPLKTRYGSTYNFDMPITWTENWNSANYYNGYYYNNIYVSSQTSLKNYLAGDAVAIAHVPGHFICLADYDPATDRFLVLDSYPTNARGTLAYGGVEWVSAYNLSGGRPSLTVGGYCVLRSTAPTVTYPYKNSDGSLTLYDGESLSGMSSAYNTNIYYDTGTKKSGTGSLRLNCTNPNGQSASTKIGGMAIQSLSSTANLSGYTHVEFDVLFGRDMTGSNGLQINFATSGQDGYNQMITINDKTAASGWNHVSIDLSKVGKAVSSADWSKINTIRYTWFNYVGSTKETNIYIDNVIATTKSGSTTPDPTPTPTVTYPYTNGSTLMLHDGEDISTLSTDFKTNVSKSSEKTQGSYSIKMACTDPDLYTDSSKIGGMMHHVFNKSADISKYNTIAFDLYLTEDLMGSSGLQINFCTDSQDGFNHMYPLNDKKVGWYHIELDRGTIPKVKDTADWSNINRIRFTWYNYKPFTTETVFYIDNLYAYNRSTVEYPYQVDENTLMVYDGEDLAVASGNYSTTPSLDSALKTQGTHGLKMTYGDPLGQENGDKVGGMTYLSLPKSADLSGYDVLKFDLYVPMDLDASNGFQMNLCTQKSDGYNFMKAMNTLTKGWHTIEFGLNGASVAPGVTYETSLDNINTLRLTWFNYSSTTIPYLVIDNIQAVKIPEVVVDTQVEAVISAITQLPEADYLTKNDGGDVQNVVDMYNELTDDQKLKVTNLQKLIDVVDAYNQLRADEVNNAIDALPDPENVAKSDLAAAEEALALYNELDKEQVALVTNKAKLDAVLEAIRNLPDEIDVLYGDADQNGVVSAADALAVLQNVVGKIEFTSEQFTAADVDGNQVISAADALLILQKVVGKIEKFPVEL